MRIAPTLHRLRFAGLGLAVGALVTAPLAHANVIFTTGNNPQQPPEQNILFGSSQTGTTITGTTNQSNTAVRFTSTETLTTGGQGQAFIEPASADAFLPTSLSACPVTRSATSSSTR